MATNRFEKPVANSYNFRQFTPNFEAWNGLLGQYQGEVNQTEALMAKTPDYLQYSQSDQAGSNEYKDYVSDVRNNLVSSFQSGQSQGRMAMQSAQYGIMEQWVPGGLASNLEGRLAEQGQREKDIRESFKDNPNEVNYAIAMSRFNLDPLRNSAGGFQGVGQTPLPAPMEAEAMSKWMADNEKGIAETLLKDDIIRRAVAGNEFTTTYDIITGTRGKTKDRIFQVLAQMVPEEFKDWYQFKHDSESYNTGGAHVAGDQKTLVKVRNVVNKAGATVQVVEPNMESELSRMLWAKATGSAYIKNIRMSATTTDYAAKKRAELAEEFPMMNPNIAGPTIATTVGGVYHDVKTFSDLIGIQETFSKIVDDAEDNMYAVLGKINTDNNPQVMQMQQNRINNVRAGLLNETLTDSQARAMLNGLNINEETVDAYIGAIRQQQHHDGNVNQMFDKVEQLTGVDLRDVNNSLIRAGVEGNVEGSNGELIPLSQIIGDIGIGKGSVMALGRGMGHAFDSENKRYAVYIYKDADGNMTDLTEEAYMAVKEAEKNPDVQRIISNVNYANSTLGADKMFSGEYVVSTTMPMFIPYADKNGNISMTKSKAYTESFNEFISDPLKLANYIFFDPKDPSSQKTITLQSQLEDLPADDNGVVDWGSAGLQANMINGAIPGKGWGMQVSYYDLNGVPRQAYIKAPKEPVELLMTNGKGFDRLEPAEYARVMTDNSFNQQVQEASREFAQYNTRLGDHKVVMRDLDGNAMGRVIFSADGSNPVTITDQGASLKPNIMFEYNWEDNNDLDSFGKPKIKTSITSIDDARNIFFMQHFNESEQ